MSSSYQACPCLKDNLKVKGLAVKMMRCDQTGEN